MKRLAIAFLVIVTGCCGIPVDAVREDAAANTRDLRLIQDELVTKLEQPELALWTTRLVIFTVASQALESALAGERSFDQRAAIKVEQARTEDARTGDAE